MKHKRGRWLRRVVGVLLLAVLCIGGTELLVCRHVEPALYQQVTAPVRERAALAAEKLSAVGEGLINRLRPVETALYVFWPPGKEEPSPEELLWERASAGESLTTVAEQREGGEVLTGGSWEVVYYEQTDPRWRDVPYGSDTIGRYGCGPTVMAMAVSTLSGHELDPGEMARWARQQGYWAKRSGSYLSIVQGTAGAYGLSATPAEELSAQGLVQALSSGSLAVALMGEGHFTDGGHFLLLRGATLGGEVLVADSSSRERSLTVWDPQLIIDELSRSRSSGAPLWYLSPGL